MKRWSLCRLFSFLILFFNLTGCSDNFLDTKPTAVNSNKILANEDGINAVLIGAYSAIDGAGLHINAWFGDWAWGGAVSNWVWGSVASDDGTKGGDITDSSPIVPIEDYTADPHNNYISDKWNGNYEAV